MYFDLTYGVINIFTKLRCHSTSSYDLISNFKLKVYAWKNIIHAVTAGI
jgi:hypothetical protein